MMLKKVAVIGGGPAGLACARALAAAGAAVELLEKSRGLGGRVATRRTAEGFRFDHGAQYVTARGRAFRAAMQDLIRDGAAALWRPRLPESQAAQEDWHVGLPGMSGLLRPWAPSGALRLQTEARAIRRDGALCWIDLNDGGVAGPYDAVAVAAPAPQALALLAPFGDPFDRIARAGFSPCWTLMIALDAPAPLCVDLLRPATGPIQWAARNNARPGRQDGPDCWTLHAAYDWSAAQLDWTPEAVSAALLPLARELLRLPAGATPRYVQAHRWRYALADRPLGQTCVMAADGRLGACGDWCLAPRVESAVDSGHGLGVAMAAALAA